MLGILVPFILWTSRKDKIKNINKIGKDLINFEITWTMLLFFIPLLLFLFSKMDFLKIVTLSILFAVIGVMYFIDLLFILVNSLRISNEKNVIYYPQIRFLK